MDRPVYVLDTSALMDEPELFFMLDQALIVIPTILIKQLDKHKTSSDELKSWKARRASRVLDGISEQGNLNQGIKLDNLAEVVFRERYETVDRLDDKADNAILGTALSVCRDLKQEAPSVAILTNDHNMRIAARSLDMKAYGVEEVVRPYREKIAANRWQELERRLQELNPRDLAEEELFREMLMLGIDPEA